jgi:hypothetical protein
MPTLSAAHSPATSRITQPWQSRLHWIRELSAVLAMDA